MKKTLYLSYDGMTDPLGQSQVLPYLIGVSRNGYQIDLISFEKPEEFEKNKEKIQKICTGANINWIPLKYTKKPPVFSTLKDVRKLRKEVFNRLKSTNYALVHCRSYITALIGLKAKRKFDIPFLFDMRGFWADERVDGGQWNLDKSIYRRIYNFFKKKELEFFQESDHIISLTNAGRNEILSWKELTITKDKITVIPCCVDLDLFNPSNVTKEDRLKWKSFFDLKDDDISIVYLGSFSTVYMFEDTLDIVSQLQEKNRNVKFIVLSKESDDTFQEFLNKCSKIDKARVQFTAVNREDVPIILSLMKFSIFFCDPSFSRKATSPTRMAELLACGVPILSNEEIGDSAEIIQENEAGFVLKDFTNEEKLNFVSKIDLNQEYSKTKLREVSIKNFDLKQGVNRYLKVYDLLT